MVLVVDVVYVYTWWSKYGDEWFMFLSGDQRVLHERWHVSADANSTSFPSSKVIEKRHFVPSRVELCGAYSHFNFLPFLNCHFMDNASIYNYQ